MATIGDIGRGAGDELPKEDEFSEAVGAPLDELKVIDDGYEEKIGKAASDIKIWALTLTKWLVTAAMVFAFFMCITVISVWLLHVLTPWVWLDEPRVSKIQAMISSGILGAIIPTISQKLFNSKN